MKPDNRIRSWEITSETSYLSRRQFLRQTGFAAGTGLISAALPGQMLANDAQRFMRHRGLELPRPARTRDELEGQGRAYRCLFHDVDAVTRPTRGSASPAG